MLEWRMSFSLLPLLFLSSFLVVTRGCIVVLICLFSHRLRSVNHCQPQSSVSHWLLVFPFCSPCGQLSIAVFQKKVTWISLINSNKARKAVHRSKGLRGSVILISCAVLKEMGCRGSTSASQIGSSVAHPLSLNHDLIVYYYRLLRRKEKSVVQSLSQNIFKRKLINGFDL